MMWLFLLLTGMAIANAESQPAKTPVNFVGSVGCAVLPPLPVTNLNAMAGDGRVILTWQPPSNGACVDEYQVAVTPLTSLTRSTAAEQSPRSVSGYRIEIDQLQNGITYEFAVTAVSYKTGQAAAARTTATPRSSYNPPPPTPTPSPSQVKCLPIPPSAPTDLRSEPLDRGLHVCWSGVANFGCTSEFQVRVKPVTPQAALARSILDEIRKTRGGCIDILDLQPNTQYYVTVTATSDQYGEGGSTTIQANTGGHMMYDNAPTSGVVTGEQGPAMGGGMGGGGGGGGWAWMSGLLGNWMNNGGFIFG